MKKRSTLGGPKTAKRKIQIREFIESQFTKNGSHSSPFDEDDDDDQIDYSDWNNSYLKKKCRTKFLDNDEDEDNENPISNSRPDEILIKRDLAEADKFIASLKLPSRKRMKKIENEKENNIIPIDFKPVDFATFREHNDRLNELKLEDIEGAEIFDDDII